MFDKAISSRSKDARTPTKFPATLVTGSPIYFQFYLPITDSNHRILLHARHVTTMGSHAMCITALSIRIFTRVLKH